MRLMLIAVAAALAAPVPATAQVALEGRVGRLESEMRAVQRKVFPGGAGITVEPQITAPTPTAETPGTPSGGAMTDLTARVGALEASVRSATGEVEQASYRIRQLEEAFNAYKRTTDARLKALEDGVPAVGPAPAVGSNTTSAPDSAIARPTAPRATAARPAAADPARTAAVDAVERPPASGDAAEDGYLLGYRLWQAKFYPEAQKELKAVADKYPKHRRASFAQNLLGRAYLDEGKPSLASMAFYDSYKKFPDGERAADSLFYLGQALVTLKKPADACKVYGELSEVYGDKLSATMKADIAKGRATAKCQ